jgi:hypothetical protein
MKKPELSTVFDSDMALIDGAAFSEIVMSEVELFNKREYNSICAEIDSWDTQSLTEMHDSIGRFLFSCKGVDLRLASNLVLDHCVVRGKMDYFKVYLLRNVIEYTLAVRMMPQSGMGIQAEEEEE